MAVLLHLPFVVNKRYFQVHFAGTELCLQLKQELWQGAQGSPMTGISGAHSIKGSC